MERPIRTLPPSWFAIRYLNWRFLRSSPDSSRSVVLTIWISPSANCPILAVWHFISMEAGLTATPNVAQRKPRYGPKLREARFEDHEQIAELESRFGLTAKPYEEWVHLWKGNPLYRKLKADWPIGWVLEDEDGKLVASMGNIPSLYELDGRKILVASGRSWVADLAYRSASLSLLDNVIRQRNVDL